MNVVWSGDSAAWDSVTCLVGPDATMDFELLVCLFELGVQTTI